MVMMRWKNVSLYSRGNLGWASTSWNVEAFFSPIKASGTHTPSCWTFPIKWKGFLQFFYYTSIVHSLLIDANFHEESRSIGLTRTFFVIKKLPFFKFKNHHWIILSSVASSPYTTQISLLTFLLLYWFCHDWREIQSNR